MLGTKQNTLIWSHRKLHQCGESVHIYCMSPACSVALRMEFSSHGARGSALSTCHTWFSCFLVFESCCNVACFYLISVLGWALDVAGMVLISRI